MAKASKKNKKVGKKKNKELSNKIEHLNTILKFSLRAIDGRSEDLDSFFLAQADRIRKQISDLS